MASECNSGEPVAYKRARFTSRLPADRLYTAGHYWMWEVEKGGGVWRVGFTKFATRMLGELVEYGFDVQAGAAVTVGQEIGRIEGFKAIADVYAVVDGEFMGANPALDADPTLTDTDPYGAGWLYAVRGTPDRGAVDVEGYVKLLDLAIDQLQGKQSAQSSM